MNRESFLRNEYLTLREEIKETKGRIFRLALLGMIGIPSAGAVAREKKLDELIVVLPLLVCAFTLVYLSESLALMRCGSYIKEVIETRVRDADDCIGWEHWLEEACKGREDHRRVDKLITYFFYALFAIYYIVTAVMSVTIVKTWWGGLLFYCIAGLFSIVFVGFGLILVSNVDLAVKTTVVKNTPQNPLQWLVRKLVQGVGGLQRRLKRLAGL